MNYEYGGAVFVRFDKQPKDQITGLDGESGRILGNTRPTGSCWQVWCLPTAALCLPVMSVAISSLSVRVTLSNSALCATFKDKAKNGNLDLAALDHHVATDPFVLWAWSPGSHPNGNGRLTPQ